MKNYPTWPLKTTNELQTQLEYNAIALSGQALQVRPRCSSNPRVQGASRGVCIAYRVMLLHVHRELADTLDMNILVNDFVTGSSNRKEIFG